MTGRRHYRSEAGAARGSPAEAAPTRRLRKRRPEWECGAAGVGAPMLCLCTTLGQDGLIARLLVVRCDSDALRSGALGIRSDAAVSRCRSEGARYARAPNAGALAASLRRADSG